MSKTRIRDPELRRIREYRYATRLILGAESDPDTVTSLSRFRLERAERYLDDLLVNKQNIVNRGDPNNPFSEQYARIYSAYEKLNSQYNLPT